MRLLLCHLILLASLAMYGQAEKKNSRYTIRGNIGIPRTITSKMFRTSFNGVYEGNISVNARLFSNFFAGVGYQNSHFQNNKGVFATKIFIDKASGTASVLSYNTRINGHAGFIKLGYDKFLDKNYVSYAINVGQMYCTYQNVHNDTTALNKPLVPQKFSAVLVQPEMAINFMADDLISFSIMVSYSTLIYKFDAKAPRFNHFGDVNEKSNKHFMSWLNIGFGFNILLGKKK